MEIESEANSVFCGLEEEEAISEPVGCP